MVSGRGNGGRPDEAPGGSPGGESDLGVEPGRPFRGDAALGLATRYVGRLVYYVSSIGSTNEALAALASRGAPSGTVYLADEQTGGRGRLGRTWFSPARGGIWVSVLLRTEAGAAELAPLGVAAAVAVAEALRDLTSLNVRVKWPNDILVDGRKAGGVLVESAQTAEEPVTCMMLGLGLNVGIPENEFPGELSAKATSLSARLGRPIGRPEVLRAVLTALEDCFDEFSAAGFEPFRGRWRELSTLRGRRVRITTGGRDGPGRKLESGDSEPRAREGTNGGAADSPSSRGTVVDIAPTGALILAVDGGGVEEVWHGDVMLLPVDERGTNSD